MAKHINNFEKHGGKTNKAIIKVLKRELIYDGKLEKEYRKYCESLGFIPNESDYQFYRNDCIY